MVNDDGTNRYGNHIAWWRGGVRVELEVCGAAGGVWSGRCVERREVCGAGGVWNERCVERREVCGAGGVWNERCVERREVCGTARGVWNGRCVERREVCGAGGVWNDRCVERREVCGAGGVWNERCVERREVCGAGGVGTRGVWSGGRCVERDMCGAGIVRGRRCVQQREVYGAGWSWIIFFFSNSGWLVPCLLIKAHKSNSTYIASDWLRDLINIAEETPSVSRPHDRNSGSSRRSACGAFKIACHDIKLSSVPNDHADIVVVFKGASLFTFICFTACSNVFHIF